MEIAAGLLEQRIWGVVGWEGCGGEEEDEKERGRWIDGQRSRHKLGALVEDPKTRRGLSLTKDMSTNRPCAT